MVKLDMSKAWNDATALLSDNFGLVATIVGLFYFLPTFAIAILFPEIANPATPETPAGASPQEALEIMVSALQDQFARSWPLYLVTLIAQYVGAVSVLALFTDRGNPTVGEALKMGLRGTPTYLATQLLYGLGIGIFGGLLITVAFLVSPILGAVVIFALILFAVYVSIKLILVPAIIGIEGELNPIKAMRRSWKLTKRNSLMIFLFLLILVITVGLIALVVGLVFGLVLAVFGEPLASIGTGFLDAFVNAVVGGLFLAVLAGVYRQLSDRGSKAEIATFE